MKNPFALLLMGLFGGCASIPDGLQAVGGFEPDRYLGTWYEIARLDHFFERGLEAVSAEYSANPDGSIRVVNRGYDPVKAKWKEAVGRAVFRGPRDEARLKVTFFWPFSGAYNVLVLAPDYSYAVVCGPNRSYFWILARAPVLPPDLRERLLVQASLMGFDIGALIFPKPAEPPPASLRLAPVPEETQGAAPAPVPAAALEEALNEGDRLWKEAHRAADPAKKKELLQKALQSYEKALQAAPEDKKPDIRMRIAGCKKSMPI